MNFGAKFYISGLNSQKSQPDIRRKIVKTMLRLYHVTLEMPEMDSTGQRAPIRVSLMSSRLKEALLAKYYVIQACASKTQYLEKFKINISTRRIIFVRAKSGRSLFFENK